LFFEAHGSKPLRITGIVEKTGYAPAYPTVANGHTLQLLDTKGNPVYAADFAIPDIAYGAPPRPGDAASGGNPSVRFTKVAFALTIPANADAVSVRVLSPTGRELDREALKNRRSVDNRPRFHSLSGDQVLRGNRPSRRPPSTRTTAAADDPDGYLDIAIVGDDYAAADLNLFHNQVRQHAAHLLTYEPFGSRAAHLRVNVVDNTSRDLSCAEDTVTPRLVICDQLAATQAVNDAAVPWDEIVIFWNRTSYGGSGGAVAVVSAGNDYAGPVLVHEFGHSFGGLVDEYLLESPFQPTDRNCAPENPNPLWEGVVVHADYFAECNYSDYYRSSFTSIMRSVGNDSRFFNPISIAYLNDAFDVVAANPAAVRITDPTEGAKIKAGKLVTVAVAVAGSADPGGVEVRVCAGVECAWDTAPVVGTDTTAPYTVDWRPRKKGRFILLAQASIEGNQPERSDPVQVTVKKRKR
jgi:hypothetical protein